MLRLACTLLAAVTFAPALTAQSGGSAPPAPPAATIPGGTYDLEITFGGGVLEGTLVVTTAGDSLAVRLTVGNHDSPVRPVERRGNRLVLEGANPALKVRYELQFRGETVSGEFTYEGQPGTVAGRRRATQGP